MPETTCDFYPNNPNNPSKVAITLPKTAESRGQLAQISEFENGEFGLFLVQPVATRPCRFGGHFGILFLFVFVLFETNTGNVVYIRERHFHWWTRDREVAREPESR